jgi:predicted transposase/invertase (TIGR01784 family)
VNLEHSEEVMRGMEFVLIELPLFKPENWQQRKLAVLWLRFLRELDEDTRRVSPDLLEEENIHQAVDLCEEGAFSEGELAAYDRYWDIVRTEKSVEFDNIAKGIEQGLEQGLEQGRVEGRAEGKAEGLAEGKVEVAKKLLSLGIAHEAIAQATGFSLVEIEKLTK